MCKAGVNELKKQNDLLVKEIKDVKSEYLDALSENFKRDFCIQQLKNQLDQLEQSSSSSTQKETLLDCAESVYGNLFSGDQLDKLESITITKSNDSNFILTAVRDLYAGKFETVKGKSAAGRNKNPITPEKCSALREIFRKRLSNIQDKLARKNGTHEKTEYTY